jgi:hypothetical protein
VCVCLCLMVEVDENVGCCPQFGILGLRDVVQVRYCLLAESGIS